MSQNKQTVVSFRVDQHLAEVLNQLPDKSAFIREAILKRFHAACPVCQGRGVLPQVISDWLAKQMPTYESVECHCCHYRYPTDLLTHRPRPDADFVCPHCADHDHEH